MRVLFMGHDYAPHIAGIGPFTTGLAEWLASRGHDVWAATTFPYYPQWKTLPEYRGRLYQEELRNGVRVRRTPVVLPGGRRKVVRRILFDTSLAASSFPWVVAAPRFDVIVCVSPPLQLAAAAETAGRLRRTPVIVHVQDLVPDAALAVGMMHEGRAVRLARRLERHVYRHAAVVSVISEGFRTNLLEKGVPADRIAINPNWVDAAEFIDARPSSIRRDLGLEPGDRLLLHTGSMQEKQGLETIVKAAALLRDDRVVIGIVGDGQARPSLVRLADSLGATNVRFLRFQDDFPGTLAAADGLLLCQRADVVEAVAPSKLLAYLASGKPVAASVNEASEAAVLLHRAAAGVVVTPERPDLLAAAIRDLLDSPERARRLGSAGPAFVRDRFDRRTALAHWENLLETVTQGNRPLAAPK